MAKHMQQLMRTRKKTKAKYVSYLELLITRKKTMAKYVRHLELMMTRKKPSPST